MDIRKAREINQRNAGMVAQPETKSELNLLSKSVSELELGAKQEQESKQEQQSGQEPEPESKSELGQEGNESIQIVVEDNKVEEKLDKTINNIEKKASEKKRKK